MLESFGSWIRKQRLLFRLGSSKQKTRIEAVRQLTAFRTEGIRDLLADVSMRDKESLVRLEAAEALGLIGDQRCVEILTFYIKQSGDLATACILHSLGWQPRNALEQVYSAIATGNFKRAAAEGSVAIEPLLMATECATNFRPFIRERQGLWRYAASPELQEISEAKLHQNIEEAFLEIKDDAAVDTILGYLTEAKVNWGFCRVLLPNPKFSYAVNIDRFYPSLFRLLGDSRNLKAVEFLATGLSDKSEVIRESASVALGNLLLSIYDSHSPSQDAALTQVLDIVGRVLADGAEEVSNLAWRRFEISPLNEFRSRVASRLLSRFTEHLTDPEESIRAHAATVLGRTRDSKAAEDLLAVLRNDTSSTVKRAAIRALGMIGDPIAVPQLANSMSDPNHEVRTEAAELAGVLRDRRAVPSLILALKDKTDSVRISAARSLGMILDVRSLLALSSAKQDRNDSVRRIASDAVAQLQVTQNDITLLLVDVALKAASDKELTVVRDVLLKTNANWTNSKEARDAIPGLIDALRNATEENTQKRAADLLGELGDNCSIAPLVFVGCLAPSSDTVSKAAVAALNRLDANWPQSEAARSLIQELREAVRGPGAQLRTRAAMMLARIAGKDALDQLLDGLGENDPQVAREFCLAIASLGGAACPSLAKELSNENKNVRANAALAISMIGKPALSILGQLIACLSDPVDVVRNRALGAIAAMGETAKGALPSLVTHWREFQMETLLSVLEKLGDASAAGVALEILFESGGRSGQQAVRKLLSGLPENQLLEWIIRASGYQHKTRGYSYDAGFITLESSDEAIQNLCGVNSALTSNVLRLVALKKDVSVHMSTGCGSDWDQTVSFKDQRDRAQAELVRRGSPPYDPSAYLKLNDVDLKRSTERERERAGQRRYQLLLSLVKAPRTDLGEDKWKYYEELAEQFRTPEVFRMLANDLAGHRYIKPSELSRFQGLLAKVGQNLNDGEVRVMLSVVQGPWPSAHSGVLQRIRSLRSGG